MAKKALSKQITESEYNKTEVSKAFITQVTDKETIEHYGIVSKNDYSRDYRNLSPGISGRPGMNRRDYEYFRPNEKVACGRKDIVEQCEGLYQNVGLVKNMIDLMSDFASQGIRISHPNPKIQEFYNNWWQGRHGDERSERIVNAVLRGGTIIVTKQTAKVSVRVQKELYKAVAGPDLYPTIDKEYEAKEIPWKYTILNPATVDVVGGLGSTLLDNPVYVLKIPEPIKTLIKNPSPSEQDRLFIKALPKVFIDAARGTGDYVIPADKMSVIHYKKDDWRPFAYPLIYSIATDIITLDKLKLADNAALDGAISNIRIFKIGNLEYEVPATQAAVDKLASALQANTHTGTMDLIWGPDIELIESKSTVYNFLGETKYIPTLNAIYAGLGIPPTLTGTYGAAGTTNNFMSLKTLIQRLEYARDRLREFWHNEFKNIQKAMGFAEAAVIEFNVLDLGNEDVIKKLYLDLCDRGIISEETLKHVYGLNPRLEDVRVERETKKRKKGKKIPKAGPYFNDNQLEGELKKTALSGGQATPSQVGLELEEPKNGEKKMMDLNQELALEKQKQAKVGATKKPGVSGQGRPSGSGDSAKRKTKTFKPRSKAMLEVWAEDAQEKIVSKLNEQILTLFGKKNLRSLTDKELEQAELIKFGVLSYIQPMTEVNEETILSALNTEGINGEVYQIYNELYNDYLAEFGKKPNIDISRSLQIKAYSQYYME